MATIKLEILLDSNEQTDVLAFSNLMNAFSGNPSVQVVNQGFTIEALKRTVEAQSPSTQVKDTQDAPAAEATTSEASKDVKVFTEAEMLKLPNAELKSYVTGLGIDWEAAEGKNTNRKLTDLVLEFRKYVESSKNDMATNANPFAPDEDEKAEDTTAEENEEAATEGGVDYNTVKLELSKKVDANREAIVAKLAEFGATKLPNLPEAHFAAMYEFLKAL